MNKYLKCPVVLIFSPDFDYQGHDFETHAMESRKQKQKQEILKNGECYLKIFSALKSR
jgi:hypothetical protein